MRKCLILVLFALFVAPAVDAQKAPNIALGFQPDKLYQFGEIDSVNLFNGNVVVRLPIGPRYAVGGQLSYQFQLVHNSTVWDFVDNSSRICPGCKYAYPNGRSNAGTGWRLSLGRLISPEDPGADFSPVPTWVYESSAGDEHAFAIPLESPAVAYDEAYDSDSPVLTAADSSGLRMVRETSTKRVVEFPNGDRHTFEAEGGEHEWRLKWIEDRFGNYVKVTYVDEAMRVKKWTVDDSAGRRHIVELIHSDFLNSTDFHGQIVDKVKLGALTTDVTPAPTATYTFVYEDVDVAWPCSHKVAANDQPGNYPPEKRTLLKRVILPAPDGSAFEFTHHATANCYSAGAIAMVTLPTMGTISYTYTGSGLPVGGLCGGSPTFPGTPVISSKTTTTREGSSTWNYKQSLGKEYTPSTDELEATCRKCEGVDECGPMKRLEFIWTPPRRWSRMTILEPEVDGHRVRRDHFFSLWQGRTSTDAVPNQLVLADPHFSAHDIRYGLPVTVAAPAHSTNCDQLTEECTDTAAGVGDGVLLTTRMFRTCSGSDEIESCSATDLLRSNYLRFRWQTFGYETDRSRTVFDDDSGCSGAACWTETRHASENGAGRFGETESWSNFTNANGSMSFKETTAYPTWASLADRLDDDKKWILDVFTEKTRTEHTVTAKTEYDFDEDGKLLATRVWKGATRGANDVLTVFGYDTKRNVIQEKSYGGDLQVLGTANCCDAPNGNPRYLFRNAYTHGALSKSEYLDRDSCSDISQTGCTSVLTTADYDVDQRSSLITRSRDSAGVATEYEYDAAFRLTDVMPTGSATSSYSYTAATASSNARVVETVKDGALELTKATYELDGLGRVRRVSKSIPINPESAVCGAATECFAVTESEYDAAGRKTRVSQPVEQTSHPTTSVATNWTTTIYDAHGRPISITGPDGETASITYTGARETTRTVSVATSASGSTNAVTTESYDAHGRLLAVKESSGDTKATKTTGDEVTTTYTYDVGGRLATVLMKHGVKQQHRSFNYDLRGFLSSETHPESGTTTYESYDARGRAAKKTEGGIVLNYEFDSAERLTKVTSTAGIALKEFKFATENDGTNLRKGKLYESVRDAKRTVGGNLTVTESYAYETTNGQMSKQKVVIARDGAVVQQSETTVEYDALRLPKTIGMPTCTAYGCSTGSGITSVNYSRTKGLLTGVGTWGTLTYHPSGMVNTVRHGSSPAATDTYEASNGIPRPSRITFGGGIACPSIAQPVMTAPETICGGATGSASVTPLAGLTYTWQVAGATSTSGNGTEISFTANASGAITLTVTAHSSCGATASSSKTINITAGPTATLMTPATTIARGASVSLSVTLSGASPRRIVWSDGVEETVSGDTWTRAVTPQRTTTYSITSVSAADCAGTASGTTTISVTPPSPQWVNAAARTQNNRNVDVSWASVPDVDSYQVERRTQRDRIGIVVANTPSTTFTDTVPESTQPVAYVYFVRAIAADTPSEYGAYDYATCATALYQQPQLVSGFTTIRAVDLAELRSATDALQAAFGLPGGSYSSGAVIRASHIAEIMTALNAVRAATGAPLLGPPPNTGDVIRAVDLRQLREALR